MPSTVRSTASTRRAREPFLSGAPFLNGAQLAPLAQPALVNGVAGFMVTRSGAPIVAAISVLDGRIAELKSWPTPSDSID